MIKVIVFIFCLIFSAGCSVQADQTSIPTSSNASKNIPTVTPPFHQEAVQTEKPPTTIYAQKPTIENKLPENVTVETQAVPYHFGTPVTEIHSGNYILYSTINTRARDKKATTEFWLTSIDTNQEYWLFTCEECEEKKMRPVSFVDNKLYLEIAYPPFSCGIIEVDLENQIAKHILLDTSATLPTSPFHFCSIYPNYSVRNYLYITQALSPDGEWQVFGTSSDIDGWHDHPDKPQSLFIRSSDKNEWTTIETGHDIKSLLWTPAGELLIEVEKENCNGQIGAYLFSPDTFTIRDISPFYCGFERSSPRVLGWLPDGEIILTWGRGLGASLSQVTLDQVAVCSQEAMQTLNTDQCRVLATNLESRIGIAYMLETSDDGIYIYAALDREIGEHLYFLDKEGFLDYRGFISEYIKGVSPELNKGLVVTGNDYDILTYVNMSDVSKFSEYQDRIDDNVMSVLWVKIP